MKCNFLFYAFLLPVFHLALHLTAQDVPPVWSDRPSEADAVPTIPKGYWQLEAGLGFTRSDDRSSNSSIFSIPAFMLKYGVTKAIELRAFYNAAIINGTNNLGDFSQTEDVYAFSSKANILHENGWIPEATLILTWSFTDTYTDGVKISSANDPGIRMAFSNTLSDKVSLAYTIGHIGDWIFTIGPSLILGQKWDVYLEYYSSFAFGNVIGFYTDGINFGFDYIVSNDFKLDIMIGSWLDSEVFNGYAVTGFAWRFH